MNALISDQIESLQRFSLKALKVEKELFEKPDKMKELEEAEVVYCSPEYLEVSFDHVLKASHDGSVAR